MPPLVFRTESSIAAIGSAICDKAGAAAPAVVAAVRPRLPMAPLTVL